MPQLYRHYDAKGRLLYVGISRHALRRLGEHRESAWFRSIARVTIKNFDSWEAVRAAETVAITTEWPQHNVAQHLHRRAEARQRRHSQTQNGADPEPALLQRLLAERERLVEEQASAIRDLRARLDAESEERRRVQAQLTTLLTDQRPAAPASRWRRFLAWRRP